MLPATCCQGIIATKIGWTQATWNPVVGCEAVSAGCDHCYAKTLHDMRHRARLAGKRVLRDGYHVALESAKQQLGDDCLILVGKNFPAGVA